MPRARYLLCLTATAAFSACGGGSGGDITQPGGPQPNTVSIVAGAELKGTSAFSPNPLTVTLASGGKITWRNDDRQPAGGEYGGSNGTFHNITSDDLTYSSGSMAPGAAYQHTFAAEGMYGYHCSIHPTMKGTISVTP